ncbi:MAG: DNA replication/repair protein RecF [Rhodospirillaceae bacterium]|nr:DNA replication/repair protein RecF [Rhodospirillaceae bacterium]
MDQTVRVQAPPPYPSPSSEGGVRWGCSSVAHALPDGHSGSHDTAPPSPSLRSGTSPSEEGEEHRPPPSERTSPPAFAVRRVGLTAFRSWRSVRLEVPARSVVLTGPNGAGKTNLLEALSLLAPGRGLRRARMAALQTRGAAAGAETDRSEPGRPETPWAVSARLDTPDGPRRVGTGLDPAGEAAANPESAPGRRILRIDGIPAKGQGDLAALGAVSWLTPEMDGLFTGPAGERRRFLDRLVAGFLPGHAAHVAAYGKAMRERNRLLREPGAEAAWLDALEAAMAERGVAVAVARADFTARLAAAGAGRVSAFPAPDLALAGAPDGADHAFAANGAALPAEDALRARLRASRAADAEAGRALAGPHRADLDVRLAGPDDRGASGRGRPAAECSTGEQKALLIALVLAAARLQAVERGAAPILLLDEVAAHLDRERRAALFDEIEGLGAQAWMTGTDAALFDALRGRACFVTAGNGALAVADRPDAAA